MKMNFIKIVKLARKNFWEVYEIRRYKINFGDNLAVANYSLDNHLLKIDGKK